MNKKITFCILLSLFPMVAFSDVSALMKRINETGDLAVPYFGLGHPPVLRPVYTGGLNDFPGNDQGWGGSPAVPVYMAFSGESARNRVSSGSSSGFSSGLSASIMSLINCLFGWVTGGMPTAAQDNDPPDEQESGGRSERNTDLDRFEGMLQEIDRLLEQTQANIALVTDMDGTILTEDYSGSEFRQKFTEYVNRWRRSERLRLIIVTRASLRSADAAFFREHDLPEPDVLISAPRSAGSTVRFHVHPDSSLMISSLPEMITNHESVVVDTNLIAINRFRQFSQDMTARGYRIENTKTTLIAWLFKFMSFDGYIVISAGDTLDDVGLLQSAQSEGYNVFSGIVVGNAEENLKGYLDQSSNIYLSHYPCLFGVVEGLLDALKQLINDQ